MECFGIWLTRHVRISRVHPVNYLDTHNSQHFDIGSVDSLNAQSDAEFASCTSTRASHYGNVIQYAANIVSWCARRIKTVVTSTCESEYIVTGKTTRHLKLLRDMLFEIFAQKRLSTLLEVENQAAITVANAQSHTKRSKYIDVRYHHLQESIRTGILQIFHTSSTLLQADALKSL